MAISQAAFDALVARVDALEAVVGNTNTPVLSGTILFDINRLELHTISRATVDGLISEIEKAAFQATKKANAAEVSVSELTALVQAYKEAIITVLDGIHINEAVTGDIDGVNRDFITRDPITTNPIPYVAGSLVVSIDNKIYYGTTYIDETDPDAGEFELLVTPGASQVVKAVIYREQGS